MSKNARDLSFSVSHVNLEFESLEYKRIQTDTKGCCIIIKLIS